jgi:hypothetical protein
MNTNDGQYLYSRGTVSLSSSFRGHPPSPSSRLVFAQSSFPLMTMGHVPPTPARGSRAHRGLSDHRLGTSTRGATPSELPWNIAARGVYRQRLSPVPAHLALDVSFEPRIYKVAMRRRSPRTPHHQVPAGSSGFSTCCGRHGTATASRHCVGKSEKTDKRRAEGRRPGR